MSHPVPLGVVVDLDGRTALVTGASAGLGAAMAIALAEAGAGDQDVDDLISPINHSATAVAMRASYVSFGHGQGIDTMVAVKPAATT